METPRDTLEAALDALSKGIVPVPCHPDTKVPRIKWKEWTERMPDEDVIRFWFRYECNIALICTGMVVFDCDDPAKVETVITECGDTPEKVRTPSGGVHLMYRRRRGVEVKNLVRIKGQPVDIRTNNGLRMIPPSTIDGRPYEWITSGPHCVEELPVASVGWTRERSRKRTMAVLTRQEGPGPATEGTIRFPEKYCLSIASVQGQNGSRGLVRMVCVMRDAGRTPAQTLDYALTVWNPTCADPPWSEHEIRHAIRRHYGIAEF